MAKKTKSKIKTFENNISRLEEISQLLESEDVGLEKSIELYEEGIKLSKECASTLKNAELKITELKKQVEEDIETESEEDLFEE